MLKYIIRSQDLKDFFYFNRVQALAEMSIFTDVFKFLLYCIIEKYSVACILSLHLSC